MFNENTKKILIYKYTKQQIYNNNAAYREKKNNYIHNYININ